MIILGDCLEELKKLEENSIDAVVTDPPYGLSFMGKKWDYQVPGVEIWKECLRVLKPGGYLLSFAGTRTQHRMAVNIEDAGFEIRDMIAWIYGSGFPKSLNIGKAVDKLQGNEREIIGANPNKRPNSQLDYSLDGEKKNFQIDVQPLSKGTSEWEGWGTALKPALEPITVARKPLSEKTVALNCLKWGTGGINIDESRVEFGDETDSRVGTVDKQTGAMGKAAFGEKTGKDISISTYKEGGRFPANLIHDGSDEVVGLFPNASRFFYCAKASKSERNRGCEGMPLHDTAYGKNMSSSDKGTISGSVLPTHNNHPTVKPIALMEYLVKLVTPPNGVVLDPFAGSGTTGIACQNLNRDFILIEREPEYVEIIKNRLNRP